MQRRPLLEEGEKCSAAAVSLKQGGQKVIFQNVQGLTFHPVVDDLLSLLGGALGEPVVTEQRRDLVCVHQLPGHEGQGAKGHLFIAQGMKKQERSG